MKQVRTRFAPSPTGFLHIGGLRTALYAWLYAKQNDGVFVLRVEDTDQGREVEGAKQVIYSTLRATGLTYDEGPDVGGDFGPYIQSERKQIYADHAQTLIDSRAAYRCFCTKERLADERRKAEKSGRNYTYDMHCLGLSEQDIQDKLTAGETFVVRQNIPKDGDTTYSDAVFGDITVPNSDLDDNVLLKTDGMPTYNLANVVDDHLMGITHVIRGVEYLSSTPKYNHLYRAFGWTLPRYIHLPVVMKDKQRKLSKRHGDASFDDFIKKGYLKEALLNYIALLGWSPGTDQEIFTLEGLTKAFSISGLSKSPAIFDTDKLTWMNAQYIRALSEADFIATAMPYFKECGADAFDLKLITQIMQPRLETLTEIPVKLAFLSKMPEFSQQMYFHKRMKTDAQTSLPVLKEALSLLTAHEDYSMEPLKEALMGLVEKLEIKNGQLLWPLRVAITGTQVTPGGAVEAACLLGKEETLNRLKASIAKNK
ncbi:MAG: glutamate--tRNA ligase [Clostridia bacterium]|jgi:glutamyl-tRNA synthetase|nr:glutamate--tRNA ligase [Clostridia bacterium]MBT7123466.1 glutamate--tRNA ligase [Clostridia bacterium]